MTILDRSFVAVSIIFLAVQGLKGGTEMEKPNLSSPEFYNLRNAVELSEDGRFTVGDLTWVIKENSESGYKCYPWDEVKEELCRKAALWDEHEKICPIDENGNVRYSVSPNKSLNTADGLRLLTDRLIDVSGLIKKAALWEHAGWRAESNLVRLYIESKTSRNRSFNFTDGKGPELPYDEYLARAFVRTARQLKLPLWIAVAIAEKETRFKQSAVGGAGEVSLMQVKPFKGRPMDKIKADPAFAIRWAMENLLAPVYHSQGLEAALLHYNGGSEYARAVMAMGEKMVAEDKLWAEVPG